MRAMDNQDYLGNNRAVINGSTGAIEQTVAYYPFGAVIADLGTPTTGQPYKFGGKELLTTNGLNEYDFGARNYYPAVSGFTKPDPLCEKYPWISPYLISCFFACRWFSIFLTRSCFYVVWYFCFSLFP